jgi:hypothetical protein
LYAAIRARLGGAVADIVQAVKTVISHPGVVSQFQQQTFVLFL